MIPKKIYQSWKTKNLPPKMEENVEKLKSMNPEYDYQLWDDSDCKIFLLEHFGENYANAFEVLKPGAFKCDFWRYAILYVYGGVYLDVDMVPLIPLREIIKDTDEFISIVDLKETYKCSIYQAFIATVPHHPIMSYSLQLSFANIVNRKYGIDETLNITGPVVVGIALNLYFKNKYTHQEIFSGSYDNDKVKLFDFKKPYIYDLHDKQVFNIKFDGYNAGNNDYRKMADYYYDDPHRGKKRYIYMLFITLIIFLFVALIFSVILLKKLRNCKKTCRY
jgi:mannosyltransferase OCH1-like enzyme